VDAHPPKRPPEPIANGFTAFSMVVLSFLKTWSISSGAGGSFTQRAVQVGMVSMRGTTAGHDDARYCCC